MVTYPHDRQEPRRTVRERVWVQIHATNQYTGSADGLLAMGVLVDISSKGLGIALNETIPPGTAVTIDIRSQEFTHQLQAVVRWSAELPVTHEVHQQIPDLIWRLGVLMTP